MLIIRDTTGITIKDMVTAQDHVRIGVLTITIWVGGEQRSVRKIGKPHDEFTINDCRDLLNDLEMYRRSDLDTVRRHLHKQSEGGFHVHVNQPMRRR